jgi:hypothetical protein
MDVMTGAFANATKIDLGKLFIYGGGAGGLVSQLKGSLDDAKKLQASAGKLAAAGYSQEFINEVIAQGPMQGQYMADSILSASPENQKAIKDLYDKVKDTSATGLDALAKQMNDGTSFATREMAKAYAQISIDLKKQLELNQIELGLAVSKENEAFSKAMAANQKSLDKAIADAKAAREKALTKASADYQEALLKAEKAFLKSAAEIKTKTVEQLDAIIAKARAAQKALEDLANFKVPSPGASTTSFAGGGSGGGGSSKIMNVNYNMPINVAGSQASPIDLQNAAMFGVKYGTPILVSGGA